MWRQIDLRAKSRITVKLSDMGLLMIPYLRMTISLVHYLACSMARAKRVKWDWKTHLMLKRHLFMTNKWKWQDRAWNMREEYPGSVGTKLILAMALARPMHSVTSNNKSTWKKMDRYWSTFQILSNSRKDTQNHYLRLKSFVRWLIILHRCQLRPKSLRSTPILTDWVWMKKISNAFKFMGK